MPRTGFFIGFAQCFVACVASSFVIPANADPARGQTLFSQFCSACHTTTPGNPIEIGAGNPTAIRNALMSVPDMSVVRQFLDSTDVQDLADFLAVRFNVAPPPPPPPAPPPPGPTGMPAVAVEYHHAQLDHYFITAMPGEIAALDGGIAIQGWRRTGGQFNAWTAASGVAGASPVCRFYIPPADGNSHFYSASPTECAETRVKFPQFEHEAAEIFAIPLPDLASGACPASTQPVYRLWNNRADSNHRYTTSLATRDAMIALRFVPEGYGPMGVVFCAPV